MFIRIISILFVFSSAVYAQNGEVVGVIHDSHGAGLPGVTVTLSDSSFRTATFTDTAGRFSFRIPLGKYLLEASFLGYAKQRRSIEIASNQLLSLDPFILQEEVQQLKEAVIRGVRPPVRFEGNKTIVSPASSVLMAQSDGFNVLRNLPGVFATEDGGIRLNGQNGVNIQIDGKEVYLSGIALINYLKSLPPGSIAEIEIIPNPGASGDASAKGGVINIILKRNRDENFQINSYLNFQKSKNQRSDWGVSTSYGTPKAGFSLDYSGGLSRRLKQGTLSRSQENGPETLQSVSLTNQDEIHNLRLLADYKISNTISLDLMGSCGYYSRTIPGHSSAGFYSAQISPDSVLKTRSFSYYHQHTYTGGVRGKYKNDKKQTLTVSFHWLSFRHKESLFMSSFTDKPAPPPGDTLSGNFGDNINSLAFQADWSSPITSVLNFQSGVKKTFLSIGNHANYTDAEERILAESIKYRYSEGIFAAYASLSGKNKNWSYTAGLRMENTGINGITYSFATLSDTTYRLSYTRFFPSVSINYQLNNQQQLAINYGHYITRPNYRDLSPSGYIVDKYTMVTGNTTLQPELTHNVSLTYIPGNAFRVGVNYSVSNGTIGQIFRVRENGGLLITPQNMASRKTLGTRIDFSDIFKVKWWKAGGSATLLYTENRWLEAVDFRKTIQLSPMLNFNNSFIFGKDWNAEITAYYNGHMAFGQVEVLPVWSVSCGIGKKLLNKKLTVRLSANDLFASIRERNVFSNGQMSGVFNFRYEETYVGISMVYSFSKGKQKETRESMNQKDNRINF